MQTKNLRSPKRCARLAHASLSIGFACIGRQTAAQNAYAREARRPKHARVQVVFPDLTLVSRVKPRVLFLTPISRSQDHISPLQICEQYPYDIHCLFRFLAEVHIGHLRGLHGRNNDDHSTFRLHNVVFHR